MATVTIGATPYDSYADVAAADTYLAAKIGAASWAAATTDTKGQALVSATRAIERFLANKVETVPDPEDDPAPAPLPEATIELAFLTLGNASIPDAASSGSNVKRAKAGSAEVEFFRPTDSTSGQFPKVVLDLLAQYLASVGGIALPSSPLATGTTECSSFLDKDKFGFNEGF